MNELESAVEKKNVSPSKLGGRKKGAKKWADSEISLLLETVELLLPAGKEQWERVSMKCYQSHKNWTRSGDSCKNKFEKLAFMKKPTGTAEIPIHVMKAKDLKEKISAHEVIGFCEENEELDFDSFDVEKSLSSANLSDTAGEVKRPETKKQK